MIYITFRQEQYECSYVDRVYEVNCDNVEELYLSFLAKKAEEMNLEINPHWGNAMNYENCNSHLTEAEYKQKTKEWSKFIRQWNIRKFIIEELKGIKLNHKEIHRF